MRVDENMTSSLAIQTPTGNPTVRESASAGEGTVAEQAESPLQQSTLSTLSIVGILEQYGVAVSFSLDANHDFVYKIVNPITGQVIKEIPPEEIATFAASLDQVSGTLIDKKT